MKSLVRLQSTLTAKCLRTLIAREGSFVRMGSQMLHHIEFNIKCFITKMTSEQFWTIEMAPTMNLPLSMVDERPLAILTRVWSFASVMCSCVTNTRCDRFICFFAVFTAVWPVARMRSLVVLQVGQTLEKFAALFAVVLAIGAC